jgi:prolipoprotein diacylglyceryltransferase
VFTLTLLSVVAGLAGARAWYVATHPDIYAPWFRAFPSAGMDLAAGGVAALAVAALLGLYARPALRPLGPAAGTAVALVLAGIAGLFAARIAALRDRFPEGDPFDPSGGGLAFFGGLAAAVLACAAFCSARRIPIPRAADAAAPAVLAGCAAGRVGCWAVGCCAGSILGAPTQLVEAVADAALASVLLLPRDPVPGRSAAFAALGYASVRFALEFARTDVAPVLLGLTPSQLAALLLAAAAVLAAARVRAPEAA